MHPGNVEEFTEDGTNVACVLPINGHRLPRPPRQFYVVTSSVLPGNKFDKSLTNVQTVTLPEVSDSQPPSLILCWYRLQQKNIDLFLINQRGFSKKFLAIFFARD